MRRRTFGSLMIAGVAVASVSPAGSRGTEPDAPNSSARMTMKKLTPVLNVEEIEPVLEFWERLGFERTMEVPDGDGLGFVGLSSGPVEIMYQAHASMANDLPQLADFPLGGTLLFIEVEDLDAVEAALEGADVVNPRRSTFYGMDEVVVREPGGHIVIFAMRTPED